MASNEFRYPHAAMVAIADLISEREDVGVVTITADNGDLVVKIDRLDDDGTEWQDVAYVDPMGRVKEEL